MYADNNKICCISTAIEHCFAPENDLSSCTKLLASQFLSYWLWIMAILSFSSNILVLLYRLYLLRKYHSYKKIENILLLLLSLSDLLLSLYLLIIAFANRLFEGGYASYSYSWRNGTICKVLAAVSTVSSQWSLGVLGLVSATRCITIKTKGMSEMKSFQTTIVCLFTCLVCIFTSLIPLILLEVQMEEYQITSDVCLLLSFTHKQFAGLEYSMAPFIITNVVILILICIFYSSIMMEECHV